MQKPIFIDEKLNNIGYNCTDCSSLIEILEINKKTNIIKFKCINEEGNIKVMNIKKYLSKMKQYKNKDINSDRCHIHNINNKYINFCINCNYHLCNECLLTRNHIYHNKINIIEFQPTQEELNKMEEIIKNYQNIIDLLNQKVNNKPKELNNLLTNIKSGIIQKMREKINDNKNNEDKELKLNNDKFLVDIKEIKKRYSNEIKERKYKFNKDKFEIRKKYKLINEKEIIKNKNKINEINKKYKTIIKNLEIKLENMNYIKKLNELVYNTYYVYNNNYYNAINLKNVVLNYQKQNTNNNYNDEFKDNNNNNINRNEIIFNHNCKLCSKYPLLNKIYYCDKCNISLCNKCGKILNHPHPLIIINSINQINELKEKKKINIDLINLNQEKEYKKEIEQLRNNYDLTEISDLELIQALNKAKGNTDQAIILLFQ